MRNSGAFTPTGGPFGLAFIWMLLRLLLGKLHHAATNLNRLMLPDKLQDVAVEGPGLLPVDRVSSFGQHDELGAGDMGELPPHDPGRRLQVLIPGINNVGTRIVASFS